MTKKAEVKKEGIAEENGQKGSELSASALKNFRHHPDMENFYRFIHDSDLRYEALQILDELIQEKKALKKLGEKKKVH